MTLDIVADPSLEDESAAFGTSVSERHDPSGTNGAICHLFVATATSAAPAMMGGATSLAGLR